MRLGLGLLALSAASVLATTASAAPYLIVGNDEKLVWDDEGKPVLSAPGRDNVVIVDLAEPEAPKIIATLPLKNSIVGPPVNLAITPDGSLALVADSVDVIKEGEALKQVLDNKIHVIDLKASPPKLVTSLAVGKQPSGLDISPKGDQALVANRGDGTVSLLSIKGTEVSVLDTVTLGPASDQVAHVVFTPDGQRALAAKFASHKLSAAGDPGREGDLQQGRSAYGPVALQRGGRALRSDRLDGGQWKRRRFGREHRHGERRGPGGQPAPDHGSDRGGRWP